MTKITYENVHIYKNRHGKEYCYHRTTKVRIKDPVGSAAWVAEVERLNKLMPALKPGDKDPLIKTLGWLIRQYKAGADWKDLRQRTRDDYDKVFNYLAAIDDEPLVHFTTPQVLAIRDKAKKKRKRHFANYVLTVMRLLFAWGVLRGHLELNTAKQVPKFEKPKDAPVANRAWEDAEQVTVVGEATGGVKVIVALGAYAFMREDDAVHFERKNYDVKTQTLNWRQRKTGEEIRGMPVDPRLQVILDEALEAQDPPNMRLALGVRGQPYGFEGFRTMFTKLIQRLEKEGRIGPDLTFHGFRHTAGVKLAARGVDQRTIAALLGHKSLAMAQLYTEQAEKEGRRRAGMAALAETPGRDVGAGRAS